jgi:hypothetical protein
MPKRVPPRDREKVYTEEDDTHDMLIKAYLEYYKHNEAFEKRRSFRTYRHARRWLREVQYPKHLNARKPKGTEDSDE